MSLKQEFTKGLIKENPVFIMALGLCPTLAVTSSVENALGMGGASTFVLFFSNLFIAALKNYIPQKVRIPCFIIVIASFVTIVEMIMNAYFNVIYKSLGLFIPLIVVNCIILGRAEAFASKNSIISSIIDGLGMGAGFTFALVVLGGIREILGAGTLMGFSILPSSYQPILIAILAPGAFITLAFLMALVNLLKREKIEIKTL